MKKKIKLSIISTLLLTSTLVITLPIVSCSGSTNPTIPINPPIYTIDATKFDSNKIVKINEVVSSIINDPDSTSSQKMTRYRNLNTYANNSELLKSVNDYFFLIDKNNNDSVIKNSIESLEIIPTSDPTLTFNQTMPKVTIKINLKPEFRKYMEDTNFSSYSFDTGTLDKLGEIKININFDMDAWKKWIMEYVGTNPGSSLTFQQQLKNIRDSVFSATFKSNTYDPPTSFPDGRWNIAQKFLSVKIASSPNPIDLNKPFSSFAWLAPIDNNILQPGNTLTGYTFSMFTKTHTININENNYLINYFNSIKNTETSPFAGFTFADNSINLGTLASS